MHQYVLEVVDAADRMSNPGREMPRAMYTTIGIVLVLYVGHAPQTFMNHSRRVIGQARMLLPPRTTHDQIEESILGPPGHVYS
jgi:hypothetical protein